MNIFKLPWYQWYPLALVIGVATFSLFVMLTIGAQYWWDKVFP